MNFIESLRTKDTFTDNGAITNSTTLNNVLDLFFLSGACRLESEEKIERILTSAWVEDKNLTLRCIFWAGDIRGGAGERRFFKIALNWLNKNYPETLNKNLHLVPHFNRWDTLFNLDNNNIFNIILDGIKAKDGLLFKWLPRKKQYNNIASKLMKILKLSPKQYRKLLVENTNVVETKMCANQWNEIKYQTVPSVAMSNYIKAFVKHDEEGFKTYIENVKEGKEKINASVVFPHTIVKKYFEDELLEADIIQWDNLPNYMPETSKILPVCDVSGSMYDENNSIHISIALGLYISERNKGSFKNAFITFSEKPTLQYLKGNLKERIKQLENSNFGFSTNLQATFDLILQKAINNKIPQEEMPEKILILSDMQFNACDKNKTNFESIKEKYKNSGYKMPSIVFWNINGTVGNNPITIEDENVALISGASPNIIKAVLKDNINPLNIMLEVLNSERYNSLLV